MVTDNLTVSGPSRRGLRSQRGRRSKRTARECRRRWEALVAD
jgi:hypothetical protein